MDEVAEDRGWSLPTGLGSSKVVDTVGVIAGKHAPYRLGTGVVDETLLSPLGDSITRGGDSVGLATVKPHRIVVVSSAMQAW